MSPKTKRKTKKENPNDPGVLTLLGNGRQGESKGEHLTQIGRKLLIMSLSQGKLIRKMEVKQEEEELFVGKANANIAGKVLDNPLFYVLKVILNRSLMSSTPKYKISSVQRDMMNGTILLI